VPRNLGKGVAYEVVRPPLHPVREHADVALAGSLASGLQVTGQLTLCPTNAACASEALLHLDNREANFNVYPSAITDLRFEVDVEVIVTEAEVSIEE
jgi:hypothetical protein